MEVILQHARGREQPEQTMQRFLCGLQFKIKSIVRHRQYVDMNYLLHHAWEAESQLAEDAQFTACTAARSRFQQRPPASTTAQPVSSSSRGVVSKQGSVISTKKTP